jgi:hypothetical protein
MRVWTSILVAVAVLGDLQASLPRLTVSPRSVLLVCIGLTIATLPMLRGILRASFEQSVLLLPVTAPERYAIDAAAVLLFLLPAHALIVVLGSIRFVPFLIAAALLEALILGEPRVRERRESARLVLTRAYELRWLLRMGGSRLVTANGLALLAVGGAELAIRNNDVVRLHSIARIAFTFAAFAAALVVAEVSAARTAGRAWRSLEAALPLGSASRLRSYLAVTLAAAAPLLVTMAVVRPVALPFAIVVLCGLALFGEARSLRSQRPSGGLVFGAATAAAVLAALDARVAMLVAIVVLPWLWRVASECDRMRDLPTVAEGAA